MNRKDWEKLQGKLVHIRIGHCYPYLSDSITVNAEILETEETFEFQVEVDDDVADD